MMIKEWQLGEDSKITSTERSLLHQEWLKEQHRDVKRAIQEKKVKEEEKTIVGFDD